MTTWTLFPKRSNSLPSHHHRTVLLKQQRHLMLVKAVLVDRCIFTRFCLQRKVYSNVLWRPSARSGRAVAPLNVKCRGDRLLCVETCLWLTDWDVIWAPKIEVLWVRGHLLLSFKNIALVRGAMKFLLYQISFHFPQKIQLRYDLISPLLYMWSIGGYDTVMQCTNIKRNILGFLKLKLS